jgi:hypothetical protein
MIISTSNYEFTHGRKPKGTGFWAFNFWKDGKHTTLFAPGEQTYASAKKWAIITARVMRSDRVAVGS